MDNQTMIYKEAINHILNAYLEKEREHCEKLYGSGHRKSAHELNMKKILPHIYRELRVLNELGNQLERGNYEYKWARKK